jgi:hypothetical protein
MSTVRLHKNKSKNISRQRSLNSESILICILILIVISIVLTTHWPALSAQAFCFDDSQYLVDNQLVQHPG